PTISSPLSLHDALPILIDRAMQPARQAHVEAEPQLEGERRAAASGEPRRSEVIGAERHRRARAQIIRGAGTDPHGAHRLSVEFRSEEHTSELQSPCNLV